MAVQSTQIWVTPPQAVDVSQLELLSIAPQHPRPTAPAHLDKRVVREAGNFQTAAARAQ
jgi:hypothetical protein